MPGPARTPKTDDKPPRPRNAWILYRSDKIKDLPALEPGHPKRGQADVSKAISVMWNNETTDVRAEYERLAERAKEEHALKYPGYKYVPMKKADKELLRAEKQRQRAEAKRAPQKSSGPFDAPPSAGAAAILLNQASDASSYPPMPSALFHASTFPVSFPMDGPQMREESQPHLWQPPQLAPVASSSSPMLPAGSHPQAWGMSYPMSYPQVMPSYPVLSQIPSPPPHLTWPSAMQHAPSLVYDAQHAPGTDWQPTQFNEPVVRQTEHNAVQFQMPPFNAQVPALDDGLHPDDFAALFAGAPDYTQHDNLDLSMGNFGDAMASGSSEQFRDFMDAYNLVEAHKRVLNANSHATRMVAPGLNSVQRVGNDWDLRTPQTGEPPAAGQGDEAMMKFVDFDAMAGPPA